MKHMLLSSSRTRLSPISLIFFLFFFFNDTATTEIYTLSLHDALPISSGGTATRRMPWPRPATSRSAAAFPPSPRSEEHTSELQSQFHLVCRLLLEKKKQNHILSTLQKKKKKQYPQ